MRLLVISHTRHFLRQGEIVGWGPTVREIDQLSHLFDQVIHLAPLYSEPPPDSALSYQSPKVRFEAVAPAGGNRLSDKLSILLLYPKYLNNIRGLLHQSDMVHVRCPSNISLLSIIYLAFTCQVSYRWVKYAGNWQPQGSEPWSYTFQRWWLRKRFHRGLVTINGEWSNQPNHVYSFFNPSLTEDELQIAKKLAENKVICSPVNLLFVGLVAKSKGVGRILNIAVQLLNCGLDFHLDIVGGGLEQPAYKEQSCQMGLAKHVTFHGWLPQTHLVSFYAKAHFMVFPSASEGWPKVLSEGMAYGVVPIASAISTIPSILIKSGAGVAVSLNQQNGFVNAILKYVSLPETWHSASQAGIAFAKHFSYGIYEEALQQLYFQEWGICLSATE